MDKAGAIGDIVWNMPRPGTKPAVVKPTSRPKRSYRMAAQGAIIRYMDQQERLQILRESIPAEKLLRRMVRVALGDLVPTRASLTAMQALIDKVMPDLQNVTLDAVRKRSNVKQMTDDQLDALIAAAPDVIDVVPDPQTGKRSIVTVETAPHR